jgi:uncharacterized protein (DUF1697 family)
MSAKKKSGSPKASGTKKDSSKKEDAFVALLRGINVGGKNMLPMKDLAAMFEKAGCSAVKTYIQSGNVVFRADSKLASGIGAVISKAILAKAGLRVPVVVRTARDLLRVTSSNPFVERCADTDRLHVIFLADRPAAAQAALLDPARSPPDEFLVRGGEIYLHCPGGIGRSKLTNAYFDAKLGTVSTVRNWRTVLKLLELSGVDHGRSV